MVFYQQLHPMTQDLKQRVKTLLLNYEDLQGIVLQKKVVTLLDANIPYYNWSGFYFMNNEKQQLEIGPYAGALTDHITIPFGKGICGQVAESGTSFEVPDVDQQDNYLACSIDTKSEIVVPMFLEEQLIGQIDIDSHSVDPFTAEDHELLSWIAGYVAQRL